MATVSAPALLKLGEGVGLLPPSVPPALTATSLFEAHTPGLALWKKPLSTEGQCMGQCQLLHSWRAALTLFKREAEEPAYVQRGHSYNRTCPHPQ